MKYLEREIQYVIISERLQLHAKQNKQNEVDRKSQRRYVRSVQKRFNRITRNDINKTDLWLCIKVKLNKEEYIVRYTYTVEETNR